MFMGKFLKFSGYRSSYTPLILHKKSIKSKITSKKLKHSIEEQKKKNRKLKDNTSRDLTTRLKNMILSVDGEADQKVINNFVDNELFALDSQALRAHINNVIPEVDMTYEFISEETGEGREMLLPMDVGFFWPSAKL